MTVAGEQGAADAERDVRRFAMKFYTEDGNWNLVGNNTPVFLVRGPYKFPDFIRTQKRDPKTNKSRSCYPPRSLPKSYRNMNGYGSHTHSFINATSERFWVKFHLMTQLQAAE